MSMERYESEEISERTMAVWEKQAAILARSPMSPDRFKAKPDEILIAYFGLHDIGVRPGPNSLHKCYVVKGKPGYMAQLQKAVAHRHGWDVEPVEGRCDHESATVRIRRSGTDEPWRHVTFTMEDAVRAGLPDSNPTYKTYPTDMLIARATTRAIGRYCPEVLLGIDASADRAARAAASYLDTRDRAPSSSGQRPVEAARPDPAEDRSREVELCSEGVEGCPIEGRHQHDPYFEPSSPAAPDQGPDGEAAEAADSVGSSIRAPQEPPAPEAEAQEGPPASETPEASLRGALADLGVNVGIALKVARDIAGEWGRDLPTKIDEVAGQEDLVAAVLRKVS
jgi:hypothetical protein